MRQSLNKEEWQGAQFKKIMPSEEEGRYLKKGAYFGLYLAGLLCTYRPPFQALLSTSSLKSDCNP